MTVHPETRAGGGSWDVGHTLQCWSCCWLRRPFSADSGAVREGLRLRLASGETTFAVDGQDLHRPAELAAFYKARAYEPVWIGKATGGRAASLLAAISAARAEGLDTHAIIAWLRFRRCCRTRRPIRAGQGPAGTAALRRAVGSGFRLRHWPRRPPGFGRGSWAFPACGRRCCRPGPRGRRRVAGGRAAPASRRAAIRRTADSVVAFPSSRLKGHGRGWKVARRCEWGIPARVERLRARLRDEGYAVGDGESLDARRRKRGEGVSGQPRVESGRRGRPGTVAALNLQPEDMCRFYGPTWSGGGGCRRPGRESRVREHRGLPGGSGSGRQAYSFLRGRGRPQLFPYAGVQQPHPLSGAGPGWEVPPTIAVDEILPAIRRTPAICGGWGFAF